MHKLVIGVAVVAGVVILAAKLKEPTNQPQPAANPNCKPGDANPPPGTIWDSVKCAYVPDPNAVPASLRNDAGLYRGSIFAADITGNQGVV